MLAVGLLDLRSPGTCVQQLPASQSGNSRDSIPETSVKSQQSFRSQLLRALLRLLLLEEVAELCLLTRPVLLLRIALGCLLQ